MSASVSAKYVIRLWPGCDSTLLDHRSPQRGRSQLQRRALPQVHPTLRLSSCLHRDSVSAGLVVAHGLREKYMVPFYIPKTLLFYNKPDKTLHASLRDRLAAASPAAAGGANCV